MSNSTQAAEKIDSRLNLDVLEAAREGLTNEQADFLQSYLLGCLSAMTSSAEWAEAVSTARSLVR